MAEILNTFLKSKMNQDLDSRILPNGEYREAINLMISKSEGADVGEFENVLGTNQIASLLPTSGSSVIGSCVDEKQNVAYVMTTDYENIDSNTRAASTNNCGIYKINLSSPYTVSTLVLGSYLNFNKSFSIYGINLIENFLYWTDNNNQPRKINVDLAQNNFVSATNQYYLTEEQISVAKYAPYQTAVLMERSSTTATATATGAVVMTVASATGIKVGDIITDHNKQGGVTELIDTLTVVTNIAGSVISFLPALANALPASFAVDFSRPSMTNQGERNLSNHSTQTVTSIQGNFIIRINNPDYGGIPRAGDYITKAAGTPVTFADDVKVVSVSIGIYSTVPRWDITVDKDVSVLLAGTPVIEIARNPNFSTNWKGDPSFLEDKFVRFSYRFQYEDNEYSLMAPFSQIAFIPKQYSEFGAGQLNEENAISTATVKNEYDQDMVNAYKSSIIAWFENDADNINVRIPLPYSTASLLGSNLKIKNIDILYKESDALAVKVLDTVSLTNPSPNFSNISYQDDLHGFVTQSFFDYNYKSSKPFKTLPQGQTTRVYDRVPVKALAQEFVGSRVVYGNYLEKLTPPASIPYNVGFDDKSTTYDNYTQYPYHTLKQNRTYQVGIVLSDIYGRQSDVILSSNDNSTTSGGSTIFLPYNTSATQGNVLAWLGKVLTMSIEQPIAQNVNYATGEPGIYSDGLTVESLDIQTAGVSYTIGSNISTITSGAGTGLTVAITSVDAAGVVTGLIINNPGSGYVDQELITISGGGASKATFKVNVPPSNPLGWYSYKIVVKQQEQEYYNVFFPGFVNGLPVIPSSQTPPAYSQDLDLYAFSTIIGDNINKVPRELTEVGPTDLEYNSEELLYIRINNPDSISASGPPATGNKIPRNVQYFPNNASQNVLNISTVRDTQLVAIPFVANKEKGDYGQTQTPTVGPNTDVTSLTGAIPWGKTGANVSFYGADQNPFILKFSTSNQSLNPIGSQVTALASGDPSAGTHCMAPILTVAETKPVFSLLDIYWETSTTGLITTLNRSISNTFNGVTALTQTTFTFPENIAVSNTSSFVPNSGFQAIDGSGAVITSAVTPPNITISSIRRVNDVSSFIPQPDWPFELVPDGDFLWNIGTTSNVTNSQFVFTSNSLPVDLVDNYVITVKVIFDASNSSGLETTFFNINANLTNVDPTITNCGNPTGVTIAFNDGRPIKTMTGLNSSPIASQNQVGLQWSLGTVTIFNTSTPAPNIFTIDSSTGVLSKGGSQNMADLTSYTVPVNLTDCDGNGLSAATCNLVVSVGAQRVPRTICGNRRGNTKAAACGQNSEWLFAQTNNNTTQAGGLPYPTGAVYPPNALYNVRVQSNAVTGDNCLTGALTQGRMELKINLDGGSTTPVGSDAIIKYWIQFRSTSGSAWVTATAVADGTLETVTSGLTISAPAQGAVTQKIYNFAQSGEYRVVTDYLRGTACQTGANPAFYVDFSDASYPGAACGILNPCT
jgi:hypothetical protein